MTNQMQEKDDIELIIESRKKAVEHFSNDNKKNREIHIVRFFLEILHVNFQEKELIPVPDDPPDVSFRDAHFEVKEILEKNRRRHQECKEALKRATVKTGKELCEDYETRTVSLDEIVKRIEETVRKERNLCSTVCKNSDLLLYVCLDSFRYKLEPYRVPEHWKNWRSISICTNSKLVLVMFADQSAPDFIRSHIGRPIRDETFWMNK
jgi:Putative endonuclease, protein of unknown function (DUF1780)